MVGNCPPELQKWCLLQHRPKCSKGSAKSQLLLCLTNEYANILSFLCSNWIMIPICIFSQIRPLTQSFIYTFCNLHKKLPVSILQTLVLNPIISVLSSLLCTVKAIYFKWASSSSSWPLPLNLRKRNFDIFLHHRAILRVVFFFQKFKKCLIISDSHYFLLHLLFMYIKTQCVPLYISLLVNEQILGQEISP